MVSPSAELFELWMVADGSFHVEAWAGRKDVDTLPKNVSAPLSLAMGCGVCVCAAPPYA